MHTPICAGHQHLLRFAVRETYYQIVVLLFGLASVAWIFTHVLAPVLVFLRQQGITMPFGMTFSYERRLILH